MTWARSRSAGWRSPQQMPTLRLFASRRSSRTSPAAMEPYANSSIACSWTARLSQLPDTASRTPSSDDKGGSSVKLSDYVMQFVADQGVRTVFMLPGGGAMHLNESLGQRTDIDFVCHLHEQAASIAAEGYAKVTNELSVLMVTTGPGGTNAVT